MKSRNQIEEKLASRIGSALENEIALNGKASLLLSGGSTPRNLLKKLADTPIPWEKVYVSLVDERFLPNEHPDQNGKMIKEVFLKRLASSANFIPLVENSENLESNSLLVKESIRSIPRPFTVVVLGMGTDGHTASIFPDADKLDQLLDMDQSEEIMVVNTKSSPYERISFSRKALLNTKNLLLHCYGEDKKEVLELAAKEDDIRTFPISAFINQDLVELELLWTN